MVDINEVKVEGPSRTVNLVNVHCNQCGKKYAIRPDDDYDFACSVKGCGSKITRKSDAATTTKKGGEK